MQSKPMQLSQLDKCLIGNIETLFCDISILADKCKLSLGFVYGDGTAGKYVALQ